MRIMTRLAGIAAVLVAACFAAGPASALIYVSENGSNAGDGTRDNPFRTLQKAADASPDFGFIYCLDPPFRQAQALTINGKSLVIKCADGVIETTQSPAVMINNGPTQTVTLDGLFIVTFDDGRGVQLDRGHKAILKNMTISGGGGDNSIGVLDRPNTPNSELIIIESLIQDFKTGVRIVPRNGVQHNALISNSNVLQNDIGFDLKNGGRATIADTDFFGNNKIAIRAAPGTLPILTGNTITNNNIGFKGVGVSSRNNTFLNTTDVDGVLSAKTQQ